MQFPIPKLRIPNPLNSNTKTQIVTLVEPKKTHDNRILKQFFVISSDPLALNPEPAPMNCHQFLDDAQSTANDASTDAGQVVTIRTKFFPSWIFFKVKTILDDHPLRQDVRTTISASGLQMEEEKKTQETRRRIESANTITPTMTSKKLRNRSSR